MNRCSSPPRCSTSIGCAGESRRALCPEERGAGEDVIKELQQVFQVEAQGKGLVRFQAIARLNAILVLTQKSNILDEAETWVTRLDRSGGEGESFYVYRVENGRAKDLASLLMEAFTGSGRGGGRQARRRRFRSTEAASTTSSFGSNGSSSGNGIVAAAAASAMVESGVVRWMPMLVLGLTVIPAGTPRHR